MVADRAATPCPMPSCFFPCLPSASVVETVQDATQCTVPAVCVDPRAIRQCGERLTALGASADPSDFVHDVEWIDMACEQIRQRRFCLLRLPPSVAAHYHEMLRSRWCTEQCSGMRADELPADFVHSARVWSIVSEAVCRRVACRIRAMMQQVSHRHDGQDLHAAAPRSSEPHRGEDASRGLLRLSISCRAHQHLDNSHATLAGPGNVAGALHFATDTPTGKSTFAACEACVGRTLRDDEFFVFIGTRLLDGADAAAALEWRPLLHRVVLPAPSNLLRANVVFLLRACEDARPRARAVGVNGEERAAPAALVVDLEVNASQNNALSHARFLTWPLTAAGSPNAAQPPGAVPQGSDECSGRACVALENVLLTPAARE